MSIVSPSHLMSSVAVSTGWGKTNSLSHSNRLVFPAVMGYMWWLGGRPSEDFTFLTSDRDSISTQPISYKFEGSVVLSMFGVSCDWGLGYGRPCHLWLITFVYYLFLPAQALAAFCLSQAWWGGFFQAVHLRALLENPSRRLLYYTACVAQAISLLTVSSSWSCLLLRSLLLLCLCP